MSAHQATPRKISNPSGLSELAYRGGTHADFLASMTAELSTTQAADPLAALRTRDPSDPTLALIDAWAVACDILTFYSERLANESYLGTATERLSLVELARLVGYVPSPGAAAETVLAFALQPPPAAVPDPVAPPGSQVTAPEAEITLAAGLRVQSVPGPGALPQIFELVEPMTGRPEWNALPVAHTSAHVPVKGDQVVWIAGATVNIAIGDLLLLAGTEELSADRWDARTVTAVDAHPEAAASAVTLDRGIGSDYPYNDPATAPRPFVMRQRLRVFGWNAPRFSMLGKDPKPDGADWSSETFIAVEVVPGTRTPGRGRRAVAEFTIDLDGAHPEITVGSQVVVSQERDDDSFYRELYDVLDTSQLARNDFGLSAPITRLRVTGEEYPWLTPRDVVVYAAGEPFVLAEQPDRSALTGGTVVVDGDASGLASGRTIVLGGVDASGTLSAETAVVESATPLPLVQAAPGAPKARTVLTLRRALTGSYVRQGAVVYANVAAATHGETVRQILGSGDASVPSQAFALAQSPLTYRQAADQSGAASSLQVQVDDVAWQQVPTLYGTGSRDRVYSVTTGTDGSVGVRFGDGESGARPRTGTQNIRATYRKGIGAPGNLAAGRLTVPLDRPLGLRSVSNPVPAVGGTDPEAPEALRANIPLRTRTLNRAVSLLDYADFALAFTGISKADASVLGIAGVRTIVLTVSGPDGAPAASSTIGHLTYALHELGDPNVPLQVVGATLHQFRLGVSVAVASDRDAEVVRAAVRAALTDALSPTARTLLASLHRSQVIELVASVPGVIGAVITEFVSDDASAGSSFAPSITAAGAQLRGGAVVGAELVCIAEPDTRLYPIGAMS